MLRKAAIQLSGATYTGLDFYLKLPTREFIELYNEVAEQWQKMR